MADPTLCLGYHRRNAYTSGQRSVITQVNVALCMPKRHDSGSIPAGLRAHVGAAMGNIKALLRLKARELAWRQRAVRNFALDRVAANHSTGSGEIWQDHVYL